MLPGYGPSTADSLARYAPQHREVIRTQARLLAVLMAEAIPPAQRGAWSGAQWEDVLYETILQQCVPRVHLETPEKGGGEG